MCAENVKQTVKWDEDKLRKFWEFEYKVRGTYSFSGVHKKPLVKKIRELIGRNHQKLIDLGCSNGDLVFSLAKYYPLVTGVDIESSKLNELKQNAKSSAKVQFYSYEELDNHHLEYDVITSIEFIEHLDETEMEAHIHLIKKLLKPEGIVFFSVPNSEDLERSYVQCPDCGAVFHRVQHMRSWTPKGIRRYLEDRDFEILKIGTTNFGLELLFGIWGRIIVKGLKILRFKMPNLYLIAKPLLKQKN